MGKLTASLLIRRPEDGRVLLLKRSEEVSRPGYWGPPGGGVEPGEEPVEAAFREGIEELGSLPALKIVSNEGHWWAEDPFFASVIFFVDLSPGASDTWEPKINWASETWGWFDPEDLPSPLLPGVREAVEAFSEGSFPERTVMEGSLALHTDPFLLYHPSIPTTPPPAQGPRIGDRPVKVRQMGQALVLDDEKRVLLLSRIASVRDEVTSRIEEIPPRILADERVLGSDLEAFQKARETMKTLAPKINSIEYRLMGVPGPYWLLSPEEEQGLSQWFGAADTVVSILKKRFPRPGEQDLMVFALLLLGVGAILAPLFWTKDEVKPLFRLPKPPPPPSAPQVAVPPAPVPSRPAPAAPVRLTPETPVFRPTPATVRTEAPIRVQAEIIPPGQVPRRTFTSPLGPTAPQVTPRTYTPAPRTGPPPFTPPSPAAAAAAAGPAGTTHIPVFPRFRTT